jgi:hypothetical protein
MREGDRIGCLLRAKGAEGLTTGFKRVHDGSKVIPMQFRIQRHTPLVENNGNKQ